jgi:hypothetical protein
MNYDLVEVVIDKLIRTFKLREWAYDIENLVEDAAEAIKLIGAEKVYLHREVSLTVSNRIVKLPRDCENIISLVPESKYFKEYGGYLEIDDPDGTTVTLKYQALPVDERGYPLIPDSAPTREAIMWYMAKILILQGVIKTVPFQMAESEWQWRCGSARAYLNTLNSQEMNKIYNDFVRLNPIKNSHANNYKEAGKGNTLDRERHNTNNNF